MLAVSKHGVIVRQRELLFGSYVFTYQPLKRIDALFYSEQKAGCVTQTCFSVVCNLT
jgi:hypothetical protein